MTVALTWNAVNGATSYNVYRSITSGTGFLLIANTVTQPNYTDGPGGLVNGVTYYYQITSITADGESLPSTQYTAVAPPAPGQPTGLAGVVS